MTQYHKDFYAWANEQAGKLRAHQFTGLDIENIAEELETLGRSEKRELISRLEVLLTHLLKWQFQSMRQSRSWELTIKQQRLRLQQHLSDNPSLKSQLNDAIDRAYQLAVIEAQKKISLPKSTFSTECPYSWNQIKNDEFYPT